ncbi:MAG: class I SAM-dependent methyltransferase [Acidimicrobiia bacterium]|nr:class I SAM-dependent methyltransferase [Acidimicrobiia bacterium]
MAEFDASYFEANYGDYAGQNPIRKLEHYHGVIRRRLGAGAFRVLDVGCGLGLWADHLATVEPDWSVSAMDVDPGVIAFNAERFPNVAFTAGRAGDGSPDRRLDVITAMDVLEHVPEINEQFARLCEWVEPGGLLAFVVPVYDGPLGPVVHVLDNDPTHIWKWPRNRWLELSGSHLDEIEWHGLFRLLAPGGYYIHFSSRPLRSIAPAIMVTGRVRHE